MKVKTAKGRGRKSAAARPPIQLSSPAAARRLLALLTDPKVGADTRHALQLEVDKLTEDAGVASLPQPEHPTVFLAAITAAADVIENGRDLKARDWSNAQESYLRLREIVTRTQGGEPLAAVLASLAGQADGSAEAEGEADESHKLTLAEAESWASSTGMVLAMQRDEDEALGFVAVLEYLENEDSNSNRAAVCNAARNAVAPLLSDFDGFMRRKTAEALDACRARVAGKEGGDNE